MSLCINCNIAISNNFSHYNAIDMDQEFISIIEEWIASELEDGDQLCKECFNLLIIEATSRREGKIGQRQFGHIAVCIRCGKSLGRRSGRRSHQLRPDTVQYTYIKNIILPRKMPSTDEVLTCNACWIQAYTHMRKVKKSLICEPENVEASESTSTVDPLDTSGNSELQHIVQTNTVPIEGCSGKSDTTNHVENTITIEGYSSKQNASKQVKNKTNKMKSYSHTPNPSNHVEKNIKLKGYSRTVDTANHCFVPKCTNPERKRVPKYLRKKILIDQKLFVTPRARFCELHSSAYTYVFLKEYKFKKTFFSTHITLMLDLLRDNSIDIDS